jgi:hypothetical protein
MQSVDVVIALTGVITVIVALITAATSARRSAFDELKQVVETLQKSLDIERSRREELEKSFLNERDQRIRIENWARRLVKQLQDVNITPAEMEEYGS